MFVNIIPSGSGGSGGSVSGTLSSSEGIYSRGTGDFNVTVAGSSKVAKIVSPGFSIEDIQILSAFLYNSSGEKETIPISNVTVAASGSDFDVTFSDKSDNFDAADNVEIFVAGPRKAVDLITNVLRMINVSPDHLVKNPGEGVIDVTNVAASTYREVFDFDGYDNATIDVICAGGVTVSLFVTDNPDADDSADTGWVSASATTITDTTSGWVLSGQEPWDRIMIKYVTSDSSNSLVVDYKFGG